LFRTTLLAAVTVLLLPLVAVGQQTEAEYLMEASRAVDPDRYAEVRGTPYRYKTFRPAAMFDVAVNRYELDSVNFNGFTHQFEYLVDGQVREFTQGNFLRVSISDDDGTEHTYGWGINPRFPRKYAELVHQGDYLTVTLIYDVLNDEKVVQDVGKTVRLRRFNPKRMHYALVDGELVPLTLSPKKIAADLGQEKAIRSFIKEHKLKPGRREDLHRILDYAERLY
jgi:hypothetical protein